MSKSNINANADFSLLVNQHYLVLQLLEKDASVTLHYIFSLLNITHLSHMDTVLRINSYLSFPFYSLTHIVFKITHNFSIPKQYNAKICNWFYISPFIFVRLKYIIRCILLLINYTNLQIVSDASKQISSEYEFHISKLNLTKPFFK